MTDCVESGMMYFLLVFIQTSNKTSVFEIKDIKVFLMWKKHAPSACTGAKIYAAGSQNMHTGCTLNFEH